MRPFSMAIRPIVDVPSPMAKNAGPSVVVITGFRRFDMTLSQRPLPNIRAKKPAARSASAGVGVAPGCACAFARAKRSRRAIWLSACASSVARSASSFVPTGGRAMLAPRFIVFVRGDGEDPLGRDVALAQIRLGQLNDVAPFACGFVVGDRVREEHRLAELGDAIVEAQLAIRELAREEAEHFARVRGDDDVDVLGIGFAGIKRRRVHEHEFARKRPRHEHEHRRVGGGRRRLGKRNLVPLAVCSERIRLVVVAVAHVNRKARAARDVVGQHGSAGKRVDQAGLSAAQVHRESRRASVTGAGRDRSSRDRTMRRRATGARLAEPGSAGAISSSRSMKPSTSSRTARSSRASERCGAARVRCARRATRAFAMRGERTIDAAELRVAPLEHRARDGLRQFVVDVLQPRADTVGEGEHVGGKAREDLGAQIGDQFALHVRARSVPRQSASRCRARGRSRGRRSLRARSCRDRRCECRRSTGLYRVRPRRRARLRRSWQNAAARSFPRWSIASSSSRLTSRAASSANSCATLATTRSTMMCSRSRSRRRLTSAVSIACASARSRSALRSRAARMHRRARASPACRSASRCARARSSSACNAGSTSLRRRSSASRSSASIARSASICSGLVRDSRRNAVAHAREPRAAGAANQRRVECGEKLGEAAGIDFAGSSFSAPSTYSRAESA